MYLQNVECLKLTIKMQCCLWFILKYSLLKQSKQISDFLDKMALICTGIFACVQDMLVSFHCSMIIKKLLVNFLAVHPYTVLTHYDSQCEDKCHEYNLTVRTIIQSWFLCEIFIETMFDKQVRCPLNDRKLKTGSWVFSLMLICIAC